jgi:calcineurin-like phosphoesterase family protein
MSTVFFTADTHFHHKAMIGKQWRPFASVEEMNELLVERWNGVVTKRDIVYHLGDVGLGSDHDILETVGRLNGTINLIAGNHDPVWPGNRRYHSHMRRWMEVFNSIVPFARRRLGHKHEVLLSHFPYEGDHTGEDRFNQFRLRDECELLLHGHVHEAWKRRGRQFNVGVDVWDWTPVAQEEIYKII